MSGGKKVYVHDTGGRGHALALKYAESEYVEKVYLLGVEGIEKYTREGREGRIESVTELKKKIDEENSFSPIVDFCREKAVDLVDVGPEAPLCEGIIDLLTDAGIKALGPTKEYAKIEGDRPFTNKILAEIGIKPTYRVFDPRSHEEAIGYVRGLDHPVVVKAGGVAAGKGSIVCNTTEDAEEALVRILVNKEFENHGPNNLNAVVEDRKFGTEISFFIYCDGKTFLPLGIFAQDYKSAFDHDDLLGMFYFHYGRGLGGIRNALEKHGIKPPQNLKHMTPEERDIFLATELKEKNANMINPNTGGTGSYCPHRLIEEGWITDKIIKEVATPFTQKIYEMGWDYRGVMYFGLNLNEDKSLSVFEVNVRHGDPEWEVVSRKLKTDIFKITSAASDGRLDELKRELPGGEAEWDQNHYVNVVAMTGPSRSKKGWYQGYPGRYGRGFKIEGLGKIIEGDGDSVIFFGGTNLNETGELITDGGRVLHIVSGGKTLADATDRAYKNIENLAFTKESENSIRYRMHLGSREI